MSRRRIFFCRVFVAACNDPEQVRKWNIWRAILQVLSKVGHGWKLRLEDDGVLSSAEILSNCMCVCVAAAFLIFWVLDWFPPIYCAVDNSIETRNKGIGPHSFALLFYICVQYWGGLHLIWAAVWPTDKQTGRKNEKGSAPFVVCHHYVLSTDIFV